MALEKWLVAPGQTKVIDIELVRALKVGMIAGKIDVIGHDETTTLVEVHSVSGKELKISLDGDTLEIDHPQLRWDNFVEVFTSFRGTAKADVSVMVPRDVALKLGVVSADALISGLRSDTRLSTISGDVVVDGVTGNLELNGVNGDFSVRSHVGDISAHTISGETTASGAIRRFSLDGVTGDVFLDIEGIPDTINTNTVSGNLTVRLGAEVPTKFHLNTVSGALQLDLQTIKGTFGKGYEGSTGALDGAFLELRANSVSGDVSVVRRTVDAADGAAGTDSRDGTATANAGATGTGATDAPSGPDSGPDAGASA